MLPLIETATKKLEDISAEIIDLRSISPMDTGIILESVKKTGRAVVVQEAPRSFGVGAEISARIMEKAVLHLEAPVERVAAPDITVPLPRSEDYYYINPDRIMRGIAKVMEF
jgi:pyruvate/2-oxoglutarate/acetoin dehydrogenase E1 component